MRLTQFLATTFLCAFVLTGHANAQDPTPLADLSVLPTSGTTTSSLESQAEPAQAEPAQTEPAQTEPAQAEPAQTEPLPTTPTLPAQTSDKSFQQIIVEIRKNEREINQMFSSIPIGFAAEQRAHMEKIEQLRATNEKLKGEMEAAAFRDFQVDTTRSPQVGQLVYNSLIKKLDVSPREPVFDPKGALEIADMMIKAGLDDNTEPGIVSFKDVAYQAFRASFALQDYDRAGLMLEQIETRGIPLIPALKEEVTDAREKWQNELMIRRLESNTNDLPRVKLETSQGDVVIELFENHAPQTVGNFISLVEKNFYNDMEFFLVVPGQFARAGCPNGNGSGDAGYKIPCECYREQIRHHFTGTISMHNTGRDTGGSQFFITHQRISSFDGKHTAFGRVIEGMDVVYRMRLLDPAKSYGVSTVEPTKIIKATVIRKRDHPYVPSRVARKPENATGITFPDQSLGGNVEDFAPGG